jgi:hypothetical protein
MRLRAAAVGVALGIGAMAGCGSAAGSEPVAVGSGVAEVVDGPDVAADDAGTPEPLFTLPIDAALPLREPLQAWRFDRALDLALVACVRGAGAVLALPERPVPSSPWVHERRYGAMRIDDARRWGYRPAPVAGVEALLAAQASIGADARAALDGVGDEPGCLDEVGVEVALRDDPRWSAFRALESMLNSTLAAAADETQVRAAVEDWSTCLQEATGLRFSHPAEPLATVVDGAEDEADDDERRIATADAACKQSVGLIDRWSEAEARLQEQMLVDRQDLVAEALALQHDLGALIDDIEARR